MFFLIQDRSLIDTVLLIRIQILWILEFSHWIDDVLIFCVFVSSSDVVAFVLFYFIFIISDVLYDHINDKFFDQVVKSYFGLWYSVINWSNKFIIRITRRLDGFLIKLWWRPYSFNINFLIKKMCWIINDLYQKLTDMIFLVFWPSKFTKFIDLNIT